MRRVKAKFNAKVLGDAKKCGHQWSGSCVPPSAHSSLQDSFERVESRDFEEILINPGILLWPQGEIQAS